MFFSRPSPKAGRELHIDRMRDDEAGTHSEKSAVAGHRAVSLHRDCVLVLILFVQVKGDGRELSTFLVRSLSEGRRLEVPESNNKALVSSYRSFHCASLNTMVAVISCIQDNEKIYDRYIFKEISSKQELIWSRIVDTETELVLGLEQEELQKRRRHLVLVRGVVTSQAPALQSHYLADSSLSQDLSKHCYTASLAQTDGRQTGGRQEERSSVQLLEVEDSPLGRHPCLPALVAVVQMMEERAMYSKQGEAPGWMRSILSVLQAEATHRNVLLFLVKLILSCPDTFLPFASTFLGPLLELLASGRLAGSQPAIDSLTSDLLTMLLSWTSSSGIIPSLEQEKRAAGRILSFLMRYVHQERRDILRHNLELLRSVLELWRPAIQQRVELNIVVDLLASGDLREGSGVQVLAAVVAQGLGSPGSLGEEGILQPLLARMGSSLRKVYQAAAETVGLLLRRLEEEPEVGEKVRGTVVRRLEKMAGSRSTEERERFLEVLYFSHLHHPGIVVGFLQGFQYTLQHRSGVQLTQCLAMIRYHLRYFPSLWFPCSYK